MGACLIRGTQLVITKTPVEGGGESIDIESIEGTYEYPTYSVVKEMLDHTAARGIGRELWPVYYDGLMLEDMSIQDIDQKCESIKAELSTLSEDDLLVNIWLGRVFGWLNQGEKFCITE